MVKFRLKVYVRKQGLKWITNKFSCINKWIKKVPRALIIKYSIFFMKYGFTSNHEFGSDVRHGPEMFDIILHY